MRSARPGVVAGLALCGGLAFAPSAQAHDWLVSSNPSAGSTVASAPADVVLTFNEPVLTKPAAPRVAVLGPDGKHYETGCAYAAGARVSAPWTAGPAGKYTVEWRVISADGHPVSDSIAFTYSGAAGAGKGRDAGPNCAAAQGDSSTISGTPASSGATGASDAAVQGPAASTSLSDGDATPAYVAGGAALAAVAAVGVLLARSRRRPDDRHTSPDDGDEADGE